MPDITTDLLNQRLSMLHEDVGEMKTVLRELTSAVNKLALVEQQQGQMAQAIERAFGTIEKIENRVTEIERRLPEVTRTSIWVDRGVWAAAAASLMFLAKKSGLM